MAGKDQNWVPARLHAHSYVEESRFNKQDDVRATRHPWIGQLQFFEFCHQRGNLYNKCI